VELEQNPRFTPGNRQRVVGGLLFCIAALILGSLMPFGAKQAIGTAGSLHRAYHFLAFGFTALLLLSAQRNRRRQLLACLAMLALAIALEVLEHLIYGQPTEWWDIRDDSFGIGLAFVFGQLHIIRRILLSEPDASCQS
jgi:peptidoglycan/LPS O-acetylase OafA/YrhL